MALLYISYEIVKKSLGYSYKLALKVTAVFWQFNLCKFDEIEPHLSFEKKIVLAMTLNKLYIGSEAINYKFSNWCTGSYGEKDLWNFAVYFFVS